MSLVNINVGVLGHIDSGKTSLVKALSTALSTAALDKHPQSQQRGITLDLGFSSFTLPLPLLTQILPTQPPSTLNSQVPPTDSASALSPSDNNAASTLTVASAIKTVVPVVAKEATETAAIVGVAGPEGGEVALEAVQFTLVDCPGHASLIRTIIGGAQIIDMILLVVDANKGIQTQTAECIVLAEITTDYVIVVLNKADALPASERTVRLQQVTNRIRKQLSTTKFATAPIVVTSAAVGGEKVAAASTAATKSGAAKSVVATSISSKSSSNGGSEGIDELLSLITRTVTLPQRRFDAPFYFAIDHCFAVRGHGTVLTGTVLSGSIRVNSVLELPQLQLQRKVKSMQMFRRPVQQARQGDRVGICVTALDAAAVERGIAAAPGSVPLLHAAVCLVKKVRYFRQHCKSNAKCHVTVGHCTVVANAVFFGANELNRADDNDADENQQQQQRGKVAAAVDWKAANLNADSYQRGFPAVGFPFPADPAVFVSADADFEWQQQLEGGAPQQQQMQQQQRYGDEPLQWALLQFQQPVYCPIGSLVIGSRLDTDTTGNNISANAASSGSSSNNSNAGSSQCRLAFFGPVKCALAPGEQELSKLRVFVWKCKQCEVFLLTDADEQPAPAAGSRGRKKPSQQQQQQQPPQPQQQQRVRCREVVVWKLTTGGASIQPFLGMLLQTECGAFGTVSSAYGADGKCRVKFAAPGVLLSVGDKLNFRYKRFLFDKSKTMVQSGLQQRFQSQQPESADCALNERNSTATNSNTITTTSATNAATSTFLLTGSIGADSASTISENTKKSTQQRKQQRQEHKQQEKEQEVNHQQQQQPQDAKIVSIDSNSQGIAPIALDQSEILVNTAVATIAAIAIDETINSTTNENSKSSSSISSSDCANGLIERVGTIEALKEPIAAVAAATETAPLFALAIVSGAFSAEENVRSFAGSAVLVFGSRSISDDSNSSSGSGGNAEVGEVLGAFGKLGKCKVRFAAGTASPVGSTVRIFTTAPLAGK